ncbi:hypothetical protein Gotur_026458 [Gossypium turneri]
MQPWSPTKQTVLRQFGCRQPIPANPEVFDEHHKIDLQLLGTDWPRYWSEYTEMWENRNEYLPTREQEAVFTYARGEAAANTCRKKKARASKFKGTRLRGQPLNEAQTFTRLIISGHAITVPNESTDAVT